MNFRQQIVSLVLSTISLFVLLLNGMAFTPSQRPGRLCTHTNVLSPVLSRRVTSRFQSLEGTDTSTNSSAPAVSGRSSIIIQDRVAETFPRQAEILMFELKDHSPLGCTVEESLNEEDDFVFISKISPGGHADKAGLKLGDVIVGVTGLFGDITLVLDSGVEKIKRLVSAVPEEDPLKIQVVRGTNVLERHESAIVDLCNMSGANDKEMENCVVDFLSGGYDFGNDEDNNASIRDDSISEDGNIAIDEDADSLIDDIMNLWADELPLPPTTSGITNQVNGDRSGKKPKPWSSRSSPSGTFVRDPKTGKMRNIDP